MHGRQSRDKIPTSKQEIKQVYIDPDSFNKELSMQQTQISYRLELVYLVFSFLMQFRFVYRTDDISVRFRAAQIAQGYISVVRYTNMNGIICVSLARIYIFSGRTKKNILHLKIPYYNVNRYQAQDFLFTPSHSPDTH